MNPTTHKLSLLITCSHCGAASSFSVYWGESWHSIARYMDENGWAVDFSTPIPSFSCPFCNSSLYDFPHRPHKKSYDDPALNLPFPDAEPIVD